MVLSFSSAEFSATNTGSVVGSFLAWLWPSVPLYDVDLVHFLLRKLAHFTEYAILGALWYRGLTRGGAAGPAVATWLALAVSIACAAVDEVHQSFVPARTSSVHDVLLDAFGASVAIAASRLRWWGAADVATGVLLWVAAVGGLAALAFDLAAGANGGFLWLTVPVAGVLLVYRRRRNASES